MEADDDILDALDAEDKLRRPVVTFKVLQFEVTDDEAEALKDNGSKGWTVMTNILARHGAIDLDFHGTRIEFTLPIEKENLIDEITHGINEQLDEITGRRVKETELWGQF